jgi:receptor expression-enhancing protein 5/6
MSNASNSALAKLTIHSGAQIIFRSFMQPVFSRYFSESGSTAANLRGKVDAAGKPHAS